MIPRMICRAPYPRVLLTLLVVALGPAAPCAAADGTAAAPTEEPTDHAALEVERQAAYVAFRSDFEAGHYNEALPRAERVVTLTEAIDAHNPELPRALDNLGATEYRLGDYIAAEQAYARALRLVEERSGASSHTLIGPLRGLALTYVGGGHNDAATPLLERAVAISRRSDGLFNPDQRDLLLPLIDAYVALGRVKDADREEQYALRISERQYGTNDLRLLPSLQRIAHWYEMTRRHTEARHVWQRMLLISTDHAHPSFAGAITALRGITNTFRLDYQFGPDPLEEPLLRAGEMGMHADSVERDAFGRRIQGIPAGEFRLDSQGKDALEAALKLAEKAQPDAPLTLAAVLVDLGDWHQLADHPDKSVPLYQRALPLLPADAGTPDSPGNPLGYPGQLLYRPPALARRHLEQPAEMVVEAVAIAEFTVTAEGRVKNIKIVEGDANENQRSALVSALARAVYRPRFADGKPVATDHVRFRETFRQMKH
jgi:tetratricopeptide (TPR) repeat protein